ncbi:MAG TPA: winged helix-turn-helix domain-containing protein [Caulobacteraceae bacterium]|nr:winged helix-turn-helix domain-containing protein [Caulobacteraceae bacterium]
MTVDLAHEAPFELGDLAVRPSVREVVASGKAQILEPRVMQVLVALARDGGQVVSRDDLITSCWGGRVVSDDAINRCISAIRRIAESHGGFSVETVARVGYRLTQASRSLPERRLAVLPFDNLSGDSAMDFFSDGIADEIQQTLARSRGIKVVARSSAFQFRGSQKAVRNVADQLQVSHVLDGSVRRSGQRIRINAQLVDCASGDTLWTDGFRRMLDDVFLLQDEIAEAVAKALEVVFSPPKARSEMPITTYETYLKAQSIMDEGARLFDDSGAAATPLLEQVVREVPDNARAWELLANARAWTLRSGRRKGLYAEGRAGVIEAAETALRLDPTCGGAYEALSLLEPWGAHRAREILLQRALRARPNDPGPLSSMSTFCWGVGRLRDALSFAERACELNPLFPAARLEVAQMQLYVGNQDASIRMLSELHRLWPPNFTILLSLLSFSSNRGYWDAYRDALPDVANFHGWQAAQLNNAVQHAAILASDDPEPRRAFLEICRSRLAEKGYLGFHFLAQLSLFGMPDEALTLAEQASYDHMFDPDGPLPGSHFPGPIFGPWCAMNQDLRFVGLCDRLGLCAYWAESGHWPDCAEWLPYDLKAAVHRCVSKAP